MTTVAEIKDALKNCDEQLQQTLTDLLHDVLMIHSSIKGLNNRNDFKSYWLTLFHDIINSHELKNQQLEELSNVIVGNLKHIKVIPVKSIKNNFLKTAVQSYVDSKKI